MTTTSHVFYTAMWNSPGCLPDSDTPPPVFKSYEEAAEYLADELATIGNDYEEGDREGDAFDRMAEECRESSEDDVFAMDGPDGYRYAVEETDSRGRWSAGPERPCTRMRWLESPSSYVVLTYTERADGLGPTAKEAADDVSSLCGSMIEQPREDNFAYVMIDSGRLGEAANELRESGFELVGSDGELVDGD
jgi:hypothetical protein